MLAFARFEALREGNCAEERAEMNPGTDGVYAEKGNGFGRLQPPQVHAAWGLSRPGGSRGDLVSLRARSSFPAQKGPVRLVVDPR